MTKYKTFRGSWLLFICLFLLISNGFNAFSQTFFDKYPFVNQTEFGGLFGRVSYGQTTIVDATSSKPANALPYYPSNTTENRFTLSLQSFNGIYVNKKTALGITVGADWHRSIQLMPIALGIRHHFLQKKQNGTILYSGLDVGMATTLISHANEGETLKGGRMINPFVGFKFPMKSGSFLLFNIGYKTSKSSISYETNDYYKLHQESKIYNRMNVRIGMEF